MKWRIRPSAFSSPGAKSSSRLNSVTNSSVRSRPRFSIARRRPWASPKRGAGMGRMARTLMRGVGARALTARAPHGPRPGDYSEELVPAGALEAPPFAPSPVVTGPSEALADAPLAASGGSFGAGGLAAAGRSPAGLGVDAPPTAAE